jgi:hypothetical protein
MFWRSGNFAFLYILLLLGLGVIGGGWWWLGRVDPLLLVPGALFAAMLSAFLARPEGWFPATLVSMLTLAPLLFVMTAFAGTCWSLVSYSAALIAVAIAVALGAALVQRCGTSWQGGGWRGRAGALLLPVVAIFSWQAATTYALEQAYSRATDSDTTSRVAVLTSLPIAPTLAIAADNVSTDLRRSALPRNVRFVDSVDSAILGRIEVLILAHPNALTPESLVIIDRWVRGGGRVLVLADGYSSWPTGHGVGDPRNPPITSLLTPLLTYWRIELDAPDGMAMTPTVIDDNRERLSLPSPGTLRIANPACAVDPQRLIARCPIDRGQATIVADADWLHPDSWRGPNGRTSAMGWIAGNPLWLDAEIARLSGQSAPDPLIRPDWTKR